MSLVQIPTTYINLRCLTSMSFIIVMLSFTSGKQKTAVGYTCSSKSHMHCQPLRIDDSLHLLSWLEPAGRPLWGFSEVSLALDKQDFSVSTPCVSPLPVGSCRFFVHMSDSAPGGDSIPPDVMITFWFSCFWSWQIASLFLCFLCFLGNLSPLPTLERFAIILARSRKLQKSILSSDLLWDDQLFL